MDNNDTKIDYLTSIIKHLREENAWLWSCLERAALNASKINNAVVIAPASENNPPVRSNPSGYVEGIQAAFPRCMDNCGGLAHGLSKED